MKNLIVTIAASILSSLVVLHAQVGFSLKEREILIEADFNFHQEHYDHAMLLLEDLQVKHKDCAELNMLLGRCYLELNVYDRDAMRLLKAAYEAGEEEALFHLGRAYHRDGQLDRALECYFDYRFIDGRLIADNEVDRQVESVNFAKKAKLVQRKIMISDVGSGINTPYDEYVPVVNGESTEMYFTSRRPGNTGGKKDEFGYDFEDVFVSYSNGNKWSEAKRLPAPLNSETHDAVVAIAPDGMTMLLYRPSKRFEGGDLYITVWESENWSEPEKWLEELNSTYQETSACFSSDGNTLFFSSTRPGGQGGKDIYRIKKLPNGIWSEPLNLGATINTPYDEDAPFMDIDGKTLYFASQGHQTMGGYDIFQTEMLDDEEWGQPENLGYPVNGFKDDIYLTTNSGGFKAYFSSERADGEGGQDIYQIMFTDKVESMLVMRGYVHDQFGKSMKSNITVVRADDGGLHGKFASDEKGKYILTLFPGVKYKLLIEGDDCMPYITTVEHGYDSEQDEVINMPAIVLKNMK